ncbi:hypothetical protein [Gramella sp. MAR_2010_147]|uniref:hypothetical protein n=1 Tax=Gramella sp. MAR_2010_147 TaxID=1250205 RepID=UPI00087B0F6D|nr:hypothetical protein [Gramella sp. MAR_2010_147]SDS48117.1 hypothetical protein SAMN04488553_2352 [Gramella sp. MAR_2010_147]
MLKPRLIKNINFTLLIIFCFAVSSCSSDDNPTEMVEVTVNGTVLFDEGDDFNGDIDGDFTGNGGSATRTFFWQNSLNTADYNADVTTSATGLFEIEVRDANDNLVLDRSIRGGTEPDSFSGVTENGTSGIWSVTIILTSFNGDGSLSLSEGD